MADSVKRPLIAVHPVLVTAHFHQVVLTVWETGGVLVCGAAFSVKTENAVGFQRTNHGNAFFLDLIPHLLTGIY